MLRTWPRRRVKIEGTSDALRVGGDEQALLLTLALSTLETGIELRDKHPREALDVAHFPGVRNNNRFVLVRCVDSLRNSQPITGIEPSSGTL